MRILRACLAVIAGYVVMAIFVMVSLFALWSFTGPSFAYEEGTYAASVPWCASAIALGVIAAVIGGAVAAVVGRSPTHRPVKILAGIVLVLGLLLAVGEIFMASTATPEERPADDTLSFFEAGSKAESPLWFGFVNPIAAFAGVLVGGALVRKPAARKG